MLRARQMLYLVFGHTAQDPPLRLGPMPSFEVRGAQLVDPTGVPFARHDGHRWAANGRQFYRVDIAGPVIVQLEGAVGRGPFDHFSLVNGTAYASRDIFAHYNEQDDAWHMHKSDARVRFLQITAA